MLNRKFLDSTSPSCPTRRHQVGKPSLVSRSVVYSSRTTGFLCGWISQSLFIFIIFCYYLHFFSFVCFSFTLFLVVVATFCTDDADKSLPVKVGSMISYAVSKVAPILFSFRFLSTCLLFVLSIENGPLLLENFSCTCILSSCLEHANLNTLV